MTAVRRLGPLVALGALVVLLRVPFVGSIGPDEGGYAYVAWRWAHGHALYDPTWIDRPQGLILVYRLVLAVADDARALRVAAIAAAAAIALLLVAAGRTAGPHAGVLAAGLFATAGLAPHLEGFTLNGELVAAVPATAAVAVALASYERGSRRLLMLAALLGSTAMLMKQSGFDGLAVVLAVAWAGARPRARVGRLALTAAAAAPPIAASAIAGAIGGWSAYWSSVVTSHVEATDPHVRASHLAASAPAAARDLLPLAGVAALGAWRARREAGPPRFALVWLAAAVVGVNVGGLYWPHYYVQLVPPLCLLGAIGLARLRDPRLAWGLAAVVALPAVIFVVRVVHAPEQRRDTMVKYALAFENDRHIARYVDAHTSPSDPVYAFVSRADFYFLARRAAAFPYLWGHPLRAIPGALTALQRTLAAPRRPKLVVLFQRRPLRRHPELQLLFQRYYRLVWRAPGTGTPVLAAVDRR